MQMSTCFLWSKGMVPFYCFSSGSTIGTPVPGSTLLLSGFGVFCASKSSVDWYGLPLAVNPRFRCCFAQYPSVVGGVSSLESFRARIFNPFIVWMVAPVFIPTSSGLPSNSKS